MKKLFVSLFAALIGVSALNAQDAKPAAADTKPAAPEAKPADAKPADAKPSATDAKPATAEAKPAAGDATKLMLGVVPNVMQYDKKELTVKAGAKVMLLFRNEKCPLQHNFILLKPGTKDTVGALADKMLTDPEALKKLYLPDSKDIIVKGAKLIGIGQSDLIEFTAPAEAGDYPYICTFPGHWRLMNGVLKVTK